MTPAKQLFQQLAQEERDAQDQAGSLEDGDM